MFQYTVADNKGPLPQNLKFKNRGTYAIANDGTINATSTKDLIANIIELYKAVESGQVTASAKMSADEKSDIKRERNKILANAIGNPEEHMALGNYVSTTIIEAAEREGFLRYYLDTNELQQGEYARYRFRKRGENCVAYIMKTDAPVTRIIKRDEYHDLVEFYISTSSEIEEGVLQRGTEDYLEEMYQDGLIGIMVKEDKHLLALLDLAKNTNGNVMKFPTFTPNHWSRMMRHFNDYGLAPGRCMISSDLLEDFFVGEAFAKWFSPIEQHEIVLNGRLGEIQRVPITTDAFRAIPELKVLNTGSVYMTATPESLGVFYHRGDLNVRDWNGDSEQRPVRGWFFFEIVAMAIANANAVFGAQRM